MARVYVITDSEVQQLLTAICRDPHYGYRGGSSQEFSDYEYRAHIDAHRFFNYQVHGWLRDVVQVEARTLAPIEDHDRHLADVSDNRAKRIEEAERRLDTAKETAR